MAEVVVIATALQWTVLGRGSALGALSSVWNGLASRTHLTGGDTCLPLERRGALRERWCPLFGLVPIAVRWAGRPGWG